MYISPTELSLAREAVEDQLPIPKDTLHIEGDGNGKYSDLITNLKAQIITRVAMKIVGDTLGTPKEPRTRIIRATLLTALSNVL